MNRRGKKYNVIKRWLYRKLNLTSHGIFIFYLVPFLFISTSLFSQKITKDNYKGSFTDDNSWQNPPAPGLPVAPDVIIYGNIQHVGDILFNGDLTINDTLSIFGNLSVGSNDELIINSGGILIVYGDFYPGNQTSSIAGGTLIVTGDLIKSGAPDQGDFEVTSGTIYIFGDVVNGGDGYTDLECENPEYFPDSCGFGDFEDLEEDSTLTDLFEGGSYSISASGPTEFCEGGSVTLSVPDEGEWYQWYRNDILISGASSYSYIATQTGDYHIRMVVTGTTDTLSLNPVTVTVKTNSTVPASASVDPDPVCPGVGNIVLSYTGGSLGTGAIAQWYSDAAFTVNTGSGNDLTIPAPADTTEYFVRFEGDCDTTDAVSVVVSTKKLPVEPDSATVDRPFVCASDGTIILSYYGGSPGTGGIARWYSDAGFTNLIGTGNDLNLPAPSATQTYYIRFEADCGNSSEKSVTVTVFDLPVVSFDPVDPVCVDASDFTLTQGSPAGGVYSGTGVSGDNFSPSTAGAGIHTLSYTYTDGNGCSNFATRDVTVNALPTVSFSGLAPYTPITDPPVLLTGDPVGGIFSGTGITGDTFDPSAAGLGIHEIVYEYTDGNGCTNSDTLYTEVLDYDFMLGAITLTDLDNWYSGNAVYSTIGATADGNVGTCWNYGNDHTRWFKFQATANQLAATFLTGGSYGTARRINAAIWEADGTTQVNCNRYIADYDSVVVESPNLIPGNWYYISMTSGTLAYRGTFSLRVNDQVDYDYYEGAKELTDITNWNSPDAAYTTRGATADKNAAPCWNTSPNYNRWFTFQATTNTISILVRRGGTYGTIRRINAAIWEADGTTLVSCNRYIGDDDTVYVESVSLTPGNWYYLSVDNNYDAYRGSFSLRVDTNVTYDYKEGAYELQDLINWCSPVAAFTTRGATSDLNAGTCWNTLPDYNRWFKFVATSPLVNVKVKTGGSFGTIRRINVAIWENDGTTQVGCNRYVNDLDSVLIGTDQLVPGNTYYISVDNNYFGYRGSFTLCVDNQINYDYLAGAKDITYLINGCSNNAEYTTVGATSDGTAPACWNTSPDYNRWFKFMATTPAINVLLKRGGVYGTIRRAQIALYDKDSVTVLDCNRYVYDDDNVEVSYEGLIPGEWYFISVDNNYSGYRGTFTLCLDDKPSYDFYEGAIELGVVHDWSSSNEAYTTIGATPDKNAATCWNTAPDYNRWFKFTATTNQIHVEIRRGGAYGTVRRVNAAIWEADGVTQVACKRYVYDTDIVDVEAINLVPGNTYYLSVDNNYSGYRGTFSLYINDAVDYDYYEGAKDVTYLINSQSNNEEYTTVGATSDKNPGTCWNTAPDYNRWFKFQATTPGINIKVLRGGTYGTIRRVNIALFEADGITQLSCNRYVNDDDIVEVDHEGLTPGNWYYFSVDNNYSGYRGTFALALSDALSYDYYEGAIELTDIHNWSSDDAIFTTLGATPDKNAASCWNTSPNYNRWFKFTATTPVINIEVRRGGTYGTIRRINAAIWESDGITQVACNRYVNDDDNVSVGANTLTPGNTYYLSVDNNYSGYRGTFSLYADDAMDYDFYEGAYEITNLNNWESGLAEFTTIGATPDKNAATCWNTLPNYNRWFKFKAIYADVSIQVLTGGVYGTIRRINLALWDSDGITQLACNRYITDNDNVSITYSGLTPGNWYYIAVDNNYSGYRGTFTLQVNNTSGNEYYAIADGNWNVAATWSLSEGGPPAVSAPQNGDIVHIKGFDVMVTGTEACAELNIEAEDDQTSLTIDGGTLTVNGAMSFINNGHNVDGSINIVNSGNLSVTDDLIMNRSGGANIFQILIQDNSTLSVQNDLSIYSSAGSTVNNELTISGTATVQINQDLILQNTGGIKSIITLNTSAGLTVKRDILFTSSAQDKLEIELNNDSKLFPGRYVQRGATPYGILDCNDNSTVVFSSDDYLQVIPENAGAGTDNFSYQNIEINNTRLTIPQLSLEGPVTVPGILTLTNGVIRTTATNLLNIESTGTISGGSTASYIEGPLKITGNSAVIFPIGKNGRYQPLSISAPSLVTDAFIAEYFDANPNSSYNIDLHEVTIDHVADCEYWTLQRSSGSSSVNVTISWDGNGCCISDMADLKVAVWDGSEWKNYGNGGTNGTLGSGDITTADVVDFNSCAITFADHLPVVDFTDPGGPYCKSDAPIVLTGDPQDSNGWFTGNGITDNGDGTAQFDPNVTNPGTHEIIYNYTSVSGCSNSVSKYVTVYTNPTASILGTDTVCVGVNVEFSIFLTGTPPWDITYTDGTNSFNVVTSDNPYKFNTNIPGTYSVTALSDNNGCIGSVFGGSAELVNWPDPGKPSVNVLSGTTTFCEGGNVVLTTPAANLYYWNNGVSTQNNTITLPGNYWVSIVDEHGCFSDNSDTTTVTVNKTARKPSAISGNTALCQDDPNTIYSTTAWYTDTYNWDLETAGAGTIIGAGSGSIEIDWDESFSGVAKLSVYGSNVNCGAGPVSDTLNISLGALPDDPGPISGDQIVCQGQSGEVYSIAPVTNASSYSWTIPTNAVFSGASNGTSITVDYLVNAVSGNITVQALNPCGASLSSSSIPVDVQSLSQAPTGIDKDDDNICPGDSVTLTVQGGTLGTGAYWRWYLDDICTLSAGPDSSSLIVIPSSTTSYWVRAEGICNNTSTVSTTISVKELPVEPDTAIVDRPSVCPSDGTIVLSYSGGLLGTGGTARWYSDAGFLNLIGTGNDLNLPAPAATQTYYIRFEADCGNSSEESVTVTVYDLPVVTFDTVEAVCINTADFVLTQGNPVGGIYSGTGITGGNTFSPALAGAGTHSITYTYTDGNGCVNSANRDITVHALPAPSVNGPVDICLSGSGVFSTTQHAGNSYSWTVTGGTILSGDGTHEITVEFSTAGNAEISVTETIDICSGVSAIHNVTVHDIIVMPDIQSNNKLTRR